MLVTACWVVSILFLTATIAGPPAAAADQSSTGCNGSWQRQRTPVVGAHDNALNSVSASSDTDAWAVGSRVNNNLVSRTLILHWDGAQWSSVHSPNKGTGETVLMSVFAASPTRAWAV